MSRTRRGRASDTSKAAGIVKEGLGSHLTSGEGWRVDQVSFRREQRVRRARRRARHSRFPSANGSTELTNEGVSRRVLVVRPQTRYHLEAQLAAITGKLLASSRAIDRSRHSFWSELETDFGGIEKKFLTSICKRTLHATGMHSVAFWRALVSSIGHSLATMGQL